MATPTPTPISYAHHILTVIPTPVTPPFGSAAQQYSQCQQIDVRKVSSWSYFVPNNASSTWMVKLTIPGQGGDVVKSIIVPDAGIQGTGWAITKADSLANGG